MRENLGVIVQSLGALLVALGFGLWLGLAAAVITLGVFLIVAGLIVELNVEGEVPGARTDEAD